ncbi:MarR family winged helix-turn-helix transcriptional regulator [Arthrobacter sp. RCC_34]|uniref:MarR family winged helix-turn-helix transcriptional regulator n=1 Tax=Arthrobacter sp. RCC_34 TaxID=3239230 RepID=UPI003525A96E
MALELIEKHWRESDHHDQALSALHLLREFTVVVEQAREDLRAELRVNSTDLAALRFLLAETGSRPVTASMIEKHLGLSSASSTTLVARLEKAGYLLREPDSRDRRFNILHPTERARTLVHSIVDYQAEALTAVARSFDGEDLAVIEDFLTESIEALRESRRANAERPQYPR